MSQIDPRLRAEREALPDPTGLGEAIARRRDARRNALRLVDLGNYLGTAPQRTRKQALEHEELLACGFYSLHKALIQTMPGTQRATAT